MKPITVGELIEALQKLDPKLPVIYTNDGSGMADGDAYFTSVEVIETDGWILDPPSNEKIQVAHLF
jgi:hypothetical protein